MTDKKRHPFRIIFRLLLLAGLVSVAVNAVLAKKREYFGLTETEARAKFEEKLAGRVGEERAAEIADEVIPKLKERGLIVEDPISEAVDEVVEELRT